MDMYLVKQDFNTKSRRFRAGDEIHVDDIDSPMTPESLMHAGYIERKPEPKAAASVVDDSSSRVRGRAKDDVVVVTDEKSS